jgi:hypothetical protein
MAMYGFDVPYSKKPAHAERRKEIFRVVSRYCLSDDDMEEIRKIPESVKDLWLWSFTNSQCVMLRSKLLATTKDYMRRYFPDDGLAPKSSLGKMIGLAPGQTILDRYNT